MHMFEINFFIIKFANTAPFTPLLGGPTPSMLQEPHKHKCAAWQKVPQILEGLATVPSYRCLV